MSRTLFWYVFKDLVRIFLMASVCLAGIMSFGGLLRPLTDQGLDVSQVGKILFYFTPAMMSYSLPIAAIYATTIVYGRLSADNELTGCRAAGISYLSIATPAIVLGLTVAITGLLLLCFIVPAFNYKVEEVIYSNLAQIVVTKIERKHEIRMKGTGVTIIAQGARVVPQMDRRRQLVILDQPMIVTYEPKNPAEPNLAIPKEFWMARQADVYITQRRATDQVLLDVTLVDGTRFPRHFAGATQGSIAATSFGPYRADSPMEEDPKFLSVSQLKSMLAHPERSKAIQREKLEFLQGDQSHDYLAELARRIGGPTGTVLLVDPDADGSVFAISRDGPVETHTQGNELVFQSPPGHRYLHLTQQTNQGTGFNVAASAVRLNAQADDSLGRIDWVLHGADSVDMSGVPTLRPDFERYGVVMMPKVLRELANRPVDYYLHSPNLAPAIRENYRQDLLLLQNSIRAEMNSRAAFAVSCLTLVVVGCALGIMFRSGNFLTAFAVSVIPAILTITVIVAGQQVAKITTMSAALPAGLSLIWSGNLLVAIMAVILMGRLQRT